MAADLEAHAALREIYEALGHDALLIQECFVRSVLVDRLARQRFEAEEKIHGPARQEAEALRQRLARGELDPHQEHPRRRVIERRKDDLARLGLVKHSVSVPSYGIGPLVKEPGSFVLRAKLAEDENMVRVAEYTVPRVGWAGWWAAHSGRLHESRVLAAPPDVGLRFPDSGCSEGRLVLSGASVLSSCAVESWTATSIDMAPQGRV